MPRKQINVFQPETIFLLIFKQTHVINLSNANNTQRSDYTNLEPNNNFPKK